MVGTNPAIPRTIQLIRCLWCWTCTVTVCMRAHLCVCVCECVFVCVCVNQCICMALFDFYTCILTPSPVMFFVKRSELCENLCFGRVGYNFYCYQCSGSWWALHLEQRDSAAWLCQRPFSWATPKSGYQNWWSGRRS